MKVRSGSIESERRPLPKVQEGSAFGFVDHTHSAVATSSGIGSQPVCTPLLAGCAFGPEAVRRCTLDHGHSFIAEQAVG
jgi:hypothetical protein